MDHPAGASLPPLKFFPSDHWTMDGVYRSPAGRYAESSPGIIFPILAGYFAGTTIAQVDDVTREIISMPDNCTTIKPECKEDYFYRFDGEKWLEEKIPTTPEECVGMVVAHESRTPHDYTLKKLFVALTAGSKTHRLARGKDLSWSVEAIPEKTPEEVKAEASAQVRAQRDALLAETDHLVMPDYPLTEEEREAVKVYRQALRDVPQQDGFPLEVSWPEKPEV